jgi:pantoate--beta-alanine ligase
MEVVQTVRQCRALVTEARQNGAQVGCVPTMGAFHEGHLSLIRRARAECDFVVVTVFVNPTQFAPGEDYGRYPRDFERDRSLAEAEGVDLVFHPTAEEMYPEGAATTVHVSGLTEVMCGPHRPGHFDGVTTVVSKLLNITVPHRAYFGEKDYQQLVVVRRMVVDLSIPVEIVPCRTVRDDSGLALSSRNLNLSDAERQVAPALQRALSAGAEAIERGGTATDAEEAVRRVLAGEPLFRLQYVEARRPETLARDDVPGPPMVIAAAGYLGSTRLIDNIIVQRDSDR